MKKRRPTRTVRIGSVLIGGNYPVAIQSMTCTRTADTEATLKQIKALEEAGCDIIRLAVLDQKDADALKKIRAETSANLVADIHFDYRLALAAIDAGIDKLRINPGNIGTKAQIMAVIEKAREKEIPIRIGVNAGSLDPEIEKKYGNGARGLVESAKAQLEIFEKADFHNIVVSLKASSVLKTIEACTMFAAEYDYPLHLGVTEAGTVDGGSIKSAVAIGYLLLNGIGATIRVSLTADPVREVKAAREILAACSLLIKPELVSCPTCGRCQYDMFPIVREIDAFINDLSVSVPLKVAIMGCVVNGPGEAKDADLGIAGGKNCAMLFKKGKTAGRIEERDIIPYLKNEIKIFIEQPKIIVTETINDDIINLEKEIFGEVSEKDEKTRFAVLYQGGKAIAAGGFTEKNGCCEIKKIGVLKPYRNRRFGSVILMTLEREILSPARIIARAAKETIPFFLKNGYLIEAENTVSKRK